MDKKQYVILVDSEDNEIGVEEKLKAHSDGGKFHRAISVFVFNNKGETMLQRRARHKYHAQGKWSNTCCSHPMPGENTEVAAHRRLEEEMGFDCDMKEVFVFPYEADVGNGLREKEYDHIFFGFYESKPKINKDEAMDWKWISLEELKSQIAKTPDLFTPWLRLMIDELIKNYRHYQKAD